jgi:exoribonuclease R
LKATPPLYTYTPVIKVRSLLKIVLTSNNKYFKTKDDKNENKGYEFECNSIREVENIMKEKEDFINNKLLLIKLINRYLLYEEVQNYENYVELKEQIVKEISFHNIEDEDSIDLTEKELSLLNNLREYTCNLSLLDAFSIFILELFGVETKIFNILEFFQKMKLFEGTLLEQKYNLIKEFQNPINIKYSNHDYDKKNRKELNLVSFSIDDKSTTEVDDAISIDITNEEVTFYVHISDVTSSYPLKGILADELKKRVSSLYFVDEKYSMLNKEMSENQFSLSTTKKNRTLTFKFKLSENGEISEFEVFPALIPAVIRLDYDELDAELSEKKEEPGKVLKSVKELIAISQKRVKFRNGVSFSKTELKFDEEKNITIKLIKESPSRILVQEFMIMANEICARFAFENNIIIPYKGTIENSGKIVSLINDYPLFHQGLGLEYYTSSTSPLRKLSDYLTHQQIKSFFRNETQMGWGEILDIYKYINCKFYDINSVTSKLERMGFLKYFRENKERVWESIIQEYKVYNFSLSDLYEVYFEIIENGFKSKIIVYMSSFDIGSIIHIKVKNIDVLENEIEFELANK